MRRTAAASSQAGQRPHAKAAIRRGQGPGRQAQRPGTQQQAAVSREAPSSFLKPTTKQQRAHNSVQVLVPDRLLRVKGHSVTCNTCLTEQFHYILQDVIVI
jgi:hypothetical protein